MSVAILIIEEIKKHPIIAILLAILIVGLPILFVAIVATILLGGGSIDNDDCDNNGGSTTVDANFSISGGRAEKQFLSWCAQQHLNAAQTAGLAGNAVIEAGGWNGTGNYFGMTTPGSQSGEKGMSSSENSATYLNWTILHKGHQKYSPLSKCPSAFKKYKSMTSKTPYELAGWWNTNVLGTQDPSGPRKKGDAARQIYKQISGGHSSVSSDTSSTAGSSQQTSGSTTSGNSPAAQIYNFFVSKEHFSAAAAAGVVAVAQRESGDGTSHSPDPSSINPKAGNGSHTGIFQCTPDRLHAGGFIKSSSDETISNELKAADYELHHDKSNVVKDVGQMSDPAKAAEKWSVEFEGVSLSDGQTKKSMIDDVARGYYKKFGGTNPGDSSSGSSCDNSGGGDTADGTGSIKEQPKGVGNEAWKPSEVPSDVKQYIHSPSSVGMSYGSRKGWTVPDSDGECVPFAVSFFQKIWGIHGHPSDTPGGKDVAGAWHRYLSGSTLTSTPHAGAVASSTNNGFTGGNSYGHTFVVEHVLANGNYIIAEQNWPGKSGSHIGKPYTWNYALVPKGTSDVKFCMPSSKYKLKW